MLLRRPGAVSAVLGVLRSTFQLKHEQLLQVSQPGRCKSSKEGVSGGKWWGVFRGLSGMAEVGPLAKGPTETCGLKRWGGGRGGVQGHCAEIVLQAWLYY